MTANLLPLVRPLVCEHQRHVYVVFFKICVVEGLLALAKVHLFVYS